MPDYHAHMNDDEPIKNQFLDHEQLALERFRCPSCGVSLEFIELKRTAEERAKDPDDIALIAACRHCEIGFTKEDWHRRMVA